MHTRFPTCLTRQPNSICKHLGFTCPPSPLLVLSSFAVVPLVRRGLSRNGRPVCSACRPNGGLWSPVAKCFPGLSAQNLLLCDPSKPAGLCHFGPCHAGFARVSHNGVPRKGRLRAREHQPARRPPTSGRRRGQIRVDSDHRKRTACARPCSDTTNSCDGLGAAECNRSP